MHNFDCDVGNRHLSVLGRLDFLPHTRINRETSVKFGMANNVDNNNMCALHTRGKHDGYYENFEHAVVVF